MRLRISERRVINRYIRDGELVRVACVTGHHVVAGPSRSADGYEREADDDVEDWGSYRTVRVSAGSGG
jgi:hypothetical protein